jgi:hypothetical protein
MTQPTKAEIIEKLQGVLEGTYSRELVGEWAVSYITNDDTIEIVDINAWHCLVDISSIDLMLSPTEYLYSNEDIKSWIEELKENAV